jgi:hypothetical protein
MPTIDLTDAEHAAATAAIRRAIEEDRFPAPRAAALGAGEARPCCCSRAQAAADAQKPKPRPTEAHNPRNRAFLEGRIKPKSKHTQY